MRSVSTGPLPAGRPADPRAEPFRRGWLLAPAGAPLPAAVQRWTGGWAERRLGPWVLRYDARTPYHVASGLGGGVHVLGTIYDVRALDRSEEAVVGRLARALALGWRRFHAGLRYTAGSHVLFIERRDVHLVLDAVGTFPACHGRSSQGTVVASHPRLVAELTGAPESELVRRWCAHPAHTRGGRYPPGLLTPYEGVEIVTPNQRFDVGARTMTRFYPDRDAPELPERDVVDAVAPLLAGQLKRIADRRPLAISLSGGMDSRLTLAASRTVVDRASYITYTSPSRVHKQDVVIARAMAAGLGLDHDVFRVEGDPTGRFDKTWELLTNGTRGSGDLTWTLHENLEPGRVHVQSYIVEIARGFYLKGLYNREVPDEIEPWVLSKLFRPPTRELFEPVFADFIAKTDFTAAAMRGLHYTDLFYWEHLAPAWNGRIIRDHRFAVESHLLLNCRFVLEMMLARPVEDRVRARIVLRLVEALWPEVLDFDVYSGSSFFDLRAGERVAE